MNGVREAKWVATDRGPNPALVKPFAEFTAPEVGSVDQDLNYFRDVFTAIGHLVQGNQCLYTMLAGEVVGIMVLALESDGGARIAELAVSPKHRGKGIGGALVREAVSRFTKVVEATIEDHGLKDFYAANGMPYIGRIANHAEWVCSSIPVEDLKPVPDFNSDPNRFSVFASATEFVRPVIGEGRLIKLVAKMLGVSRNRAEELATMTREEAASRDALGV